MLVYIDMKRYLYQKNPWWQGQAFKMGILRPQYLDPLLAHIDTRFIQMITGLRRVGKSTLAIQLIDHLIEDSKLDPKRILFFSVEEPALMKLSIIEVINWFRAEQGISSTEKIYVFIDEVQFREGWEREIKSIYDSENIKFILTGSSTMLLSEKLSFLTGRYLKLRVYPLDFNEYLRFKQVKISYADDFLLQRNLEEFMVIGGMPEYVLHPTDEYLETTVESILFKDLVTKFSLRNPSILLDLIYLLADRVGTVAGTVRLAKVLQISKDTVGMYLEYLDKALITTALPSYALSRNKVIYSSNKVYFADLGMYSKYASKTNYGALAENAVFNHLLPEADKLTRVKFGYWYENRSEIDFVMEQDSGLSLVESKWVDDMKQIKFQPLKKALTELKPKRVVYVTKNLRAETEVEGVKVRCVPLREYLLRG